MAAVSMTLGTGELGNALLRRHLEQAIADSLPVRVIVAAADDPDLVDRGSDASKTRKTFHIPEFGEGRAAIVEPARKILAFLAPLTQ